jgi:ketosteroid isomerase-like protein
MGRRAGLSIVVMMITILPAVVQIYAQSTEQSTQPTAEIEQALTVFLAAFDNLDWPAFRACFAPDASIFHPAPPNLKRIDSPQEFERAWLDVFARIKKNSGRNSPPYMHLSPQDLKIELLSEDAALVTFHLLDGTTLSRRTIILKRSSGSWKIVHLHASNLAMPVP